MSLTSKFDWERLIRANIKKVDQTRFHDKGLGTKGNCLSAAFATVFGLDLAIVPVFVDMEPHMWMDHMIDWLKFGGYGFKYGEAGDYPTDKLYIASGPSPRGVSHSVVYLNGKMIHDPHPSRSGLVEINQIWWFPPLQSARRSDSEGAAPSSKPDQSQHSRAHFEKCMREYDPNARFKTNDAGDYYDEAVKTAWRMYLAAPSAPVVQASLTDEQILARAQALIRDAAAVGQVVTIELRNQQPPSMGNYAMVAEVRPAREKAKPREVCNNCDTALPEGCGGIFKGDAECRFAGPEVEKE